MADTGWTLVHRATLEETKEIRDILIHAGIECTIENASNKEEDLQKLKSLLAAYEPPVGVARILTPFNFGTDTQLFDLFTKDTDAKHAIELIHQHYRMEKDAPDTTTNEVVKIASGMIRCPACGHEFADGLSECPNCGLFLGD